MPLPAPAIVRGKVETEARARIFWGDSREEVIAYMVVQGIDRADASEFADAVLKERFQTIRGIGLRRVLIGLPLICLPVVAWFCLMAVHRVHARSFARLFALTIMAGLYGLWSFLTGLIMFISPKTESGDVADK